MNNSIVFRNIIIYAFCVPLAIFVGYMLKDPLNYSTFYVIGALALVVISPLLMRWHFPILIFSWNFPFYVIFLKGQPQFWLVMVAISFLISLLERALNREGRFIQVRQISLPLICLSCVVFMTAKLTGGFGLRAFGSDVWGGRKYIFLLVGILSYFALTARRIPRERVALYVSLFYLSGVLHTIGDLFRLAPSSLNFVFWFFPPSSMPDEWQLGTTRLGGMGTGAASVTLWLLARYGVRGIFYSGKTWRIVLFAFCFAAQCLGGFRSILLGTTTIFAFQFYLEGMHRTKLFPVFVMCGLLGGALLIPFAAKLPFTFQRTLAFLPLELNPDARRDAEGSSQWRIDMWNALLPQVPRYLLLGKGYALTQEDSQMMGLDSSFRSIDASQEGLAVSGDYHNGPLSVLIPFGIWGAIVFIWFMGAGLWVVYHNYCNGDPDQRLINGFLLAVTVKQIVFFFFIFGALSSDVGVLVGPIGLSICINGGVRRTKPEAAPSPPASSPHSFTPRGRPSFQR